MKEKTNLMYIIFIFIIIIMNFMIYIYSKSFFYIDILNKLSSFINFRNKVNQMILEEFILIIFIIIFLVLFSIFFYFFSKIKDKTLKVNIEDRNNISQKVKKINFHFISYILMFVILVYVTSFFMQILENRIAIELSSNTQKEFIKEAINEGIFKINKNLPIFGTFLQLKLGFIWLIFSMLIYFIIYGFEEYIFRYKYFKFFDFEGYNKSILLNSLSFSILHLSRGITTMIFAFIICYTILGPIYIKYKNIRYNIIIHYLINLFSELFSIIFPEYIFIKLYKTNIFILFFITLSALLLLLAFYIFKIKKLNKDFYLN